MWEDLYKELSRLTSFDESLYRKFAEVYLEENFKNDIDSIRSYTFVYNDLCDDVKVILDAPYIFHTRNFSSFLEDPLKHMIKVFISKSHTLINGNVDINKFKFIINLTIKKCIDTNLKCLFQNFVALSIPYLLHDHDIKFLYPKNKWIMLSRKGIQSNDSLPPNYVLEVDNNRFSFFIEAPRPIDWSRRVRKGSKIPLNAAPRPDIMVYRGFVKNILVSSSPTIIKRPNLVIECKEVDGWWKKTRFSKGIMNLTNGELEDVDAVDVIDVYLSLYKPKKIFIVSKVDVPRGVKYKLSLRGVETIDDTDLNPFNLLQLTQYLLGMK